MQTLHLEIVLVDTCVITMDYPPTYSLEDLYSELIFAKALGRVVNITMYATSVADYPVDTRIILHEWVRDPKNVKGHGQLT